MQAILTGGQHNRQLILRRLPAGVKLPAVGQASRLPFFMQKIPPTYAAGRLTGSGVVCGGGPPNWKRAFRNRLPTPSVRPPNPGWLTGWAAIEPRSPPGQPEALVEPGPPRCRAGPLGRRPAAVESGAKGCFFAREQRAPGPSRPAKLRRPVGAPVARQHSATSPACRVAPAHPPRCQTSVGSPYRYGPGRQSVVHA